MNLNDNFYYYTTATANRRIPCMLDAGFDEAGSLQALGSAVSLKLVANLAAGKIEA